MVKKIIIVLSIILLLVTGLIFFLTKQGVLFKSNQEPSETIDASQLTPTPTLTVVDLDDQNVFSSKDSKLQMIYPAAWQTEDITTPNDTDTIQAVNLTSSDGDIRVNITISQQYDTVLAQVTNCDNNPNIVCESIINNTRPAIIAKSQNSNPQVISIYSIFARKIFKIDFTINQNNNQTQNIETVNKIISAIKFF